MSSDKPRLVKDYENLPQEIQEQIKLTYPYGFDKHLIRFQNSKKEFVSALPFESDTTYYLVRMTAAEAREIIEEDADYDESGELKDNVLEEYQEKYDEESDEDDDEEDE